MEILWTDSDRLLKNLIGWFDDGTVDVSPVKQQCLDELLRGLSDNNTSIESLCIWFYCENVSSFFDLDHLVRGSTNLKWVSIRSLSLRACSANQVQMITRTLQNNELPSFDMTGCNLDEDERGHIIAACSNIRKLIVKLPHSNALWNRLRTLLQNPFSKMIILDIGEYNLGNQTVALIEVTNL